MGIKMHYTAEVSKVRSRLILDERLSRAWNEARAELNKYRNKWKAVNIEDVVDPNADLSSLKITNRKIIYPSIFPGLKVIADFGGGYLRIYNSDTHKFYDTDGNIIENADSTSGRRRSHFRILKLEEMKNYGK